MTRSCRLMLFGGPEVKTVEKDCQEWCEALSSGRQKVKMNTSTQIRATRTLTALKLSKLKPNLVFYILSLDFF